MKLLTEKEQNDSLRLALVLFVLSLCVAAYSEIHKQGSVSFPNEIH